MRDGGGLKGLAACTCTRPSVQEGLVEGELRSVSDIGSTVLAFAEIILQIVRSFFPSNFLPILAKFLRKIAAVRDDVKLSCLGFLAQGWSNSREELSEKP